MRTPICPFVNGSYMSGATKKGLPVFKVAVRHKRLFFPGICDGDAAYRQIELACKCVVHKRRPRRLHILYVDAQAAGKILSKFRVETDKLPVSVSR